MEPAKRPSDNSLSNPGMPENKFPRGPNSKDSSPQNPTLLKALEAVLIAGRRGLLGPEAMAAAGGSGAELVPGGSNGVAPPAVAPPAVAPPDTLNPIPCLARGEKKKKVFSEMRTPVITVVQQVKGEPSSPKKRSYINCIIQRAGTRRLPCPTALIIQCKLQ